MYACGFLERCNRAHFGFGREVGRTPRHDAQELSPVQQVAAV